MLQRGFVYDGWMCFDERSSFAMAPLNSQRIRFREQVSGVFEDVLQGNIVRSLLEGLRHVTDLLDHDKGATVGSIPQVRSWCEGRRYGRYVCLSSAGLDFPDRHPNLEMANMRPEMRVLKKPNPTLIETGIGPLDFD